MAPQLMESSVAQLSELEIEFGVRPAHPFNHLPTQFHRRGKRLGVPAKDVAKVDVEKVAVMCEEKVIEVAVPNPQEVGNDAVAGARTDVGIHHFRGDAVWAGLAGCNVAEEVEDPPVDTQHLREGSGVGGIREEKKGQVCLGVLSKVKEKCLPCQSGEREREGETEGDRENEW